MNSIKLKKILQNSKENLENTKEELEENDINEHGEIKEQNCKRAIYSLHEYKKTNK